MNPEHILAPGGRALTRLMSQALPGQAHPGLVYDRYLALWDGNRRNPTLEPLQAFVEDFNHRPGDSGQALLDAYQRRLDRALSGSAHDRRTYRCHWRLVSGLGSAHPTENGFSFDPVLGLPILAGSGLKGLCRTAAGHFDLDWQQRETLFGPGQILDEEDGRTGDLCFYDAYPSRWPRLCVDLVNCHHPAYYRQQEKGRAVAPTDTENPIPVFFLAVEQGARFTIRLGSRSGNTANLEQGWELLDFGLLYLGFGAKTAVGYGTLERCEDSPDDTPGSVPWLDETLARLAAAHNTREEEVLRGRLLAEAWAALPEGAEKTAALGEIRRRWQRRGWWDQPQGRAQKKARDIYERS